MGNKKKKEKSIAHCKTEEVHTIDKFGKIFAALMRSGMFRGMGPVEDSCFTLFVQPDSPSYVATKIHVVMDNEGKVRFEIDINGRKPWIGSAFMDVSPDDAVNRLTEFLVSRIVSSWRLRRTTGRLKALERK